MVCLLPSFFDCADKDIVPSTIVFLEKHVQEQAVDAGRFLRNKKAPHSGPDMYIKTPAKKPRMPWRSTCSKSTKRKKLMDRLRAHMKLNEGIGKKRTDSETKALIRSDGY